MDGAGRALDALRQARRAGAARGRAGRAPRGRRHGQGSPAPPRPPRPSRPARRAGGAGSRGSATGSTSRSSTDAGIGRPASWSTTCGQPLQRGLAAVRGRRARHPATATTPCHAGRNRASATGSTGSTSWRSRASERRRSERSTSGSQNSRDAPPGRNSPASSVPAPTSRWSASVDDALRQPPAPRRLHGDERAVGAGVPGEQPVERARRRGEERRRHARRRRHAHAVAVARRVLHRDPALLAGDPRPHRPARRRQLREVQRRLHASAGRPRPGLVGRQVAQAAQQVVDLVRGLRLPLLGQRLEAQLEVREGIRVEQLPQLLLAQQLAQQVAVQRERLGPALGQRRVALVHVGGDVVEQERARERRRACRLDGVDGDVAALRRRRAPRAGRAGRTRPRGTRGTSRRGSGSCRTATRPRAGRRRAGAAARAASCVPGRRRGSSSARAAFSRNRLANRLDWPTRPTTRSSTSSGSGNSSASTPSSEPSPSGSRMAMPSSDQIVWTSSPRRSARRASIAIVHGAWTRPPNGVRTTSRQSPSSSRKRSTTIRRSVGRAPAAARSSSR